MSKSLGTFKFRNAQNPWRNCFYYISCLIFFHWSPLLSRVSIALIWLIAYSHFKKLLAFLWFEILAVFLIKRKEGLKMFMLLQQRTGLRYWWSEEEGSWIKGIKMWYAHVTTPHKEYNHYTLHKCTKIKNKKFSYLKLSFNWKV